MIYDALTTKFTVIISATQVLAIRVRRVTKTMGVQPFCLRLGRHWGCNLFVCVWEDTGGATFLFASGFGSRCSSGANENALRFRFGPDCGRDFPQVQ